MENEQIIRHPLWSDSKLAPETPGVYFMLDTTGTILYVGKAKNLKNRLMTYFQRVPHEVGRTARMLTQVIRFDILLTTTEVEALILEATLIKRHLPKYNIRLKDDKSYPYLRIPQGKEVEGPDAFPRIEWTRKARKDGARYFGPFPSSYSARIMLQLLNERFRLRDCKDNSFRHRSRPCILYQMDRCTAPCVGYISQTEYSKSLDQAIAVLEGKDPQFLESLEAEMAVAAEEEDFERAAFLRDLMDPLRLVTQAQVADQAGLGVSKDVVHLAFNEQRGFAVLLMVRHGRLVGIQHGEIQNIGVDESSSKEALLAKVLEQFYLGNKSDYGGPGAQEVLVPWLPDELVLIGQGIGLPINLANSDADSQLLRVAEMNVKHALGQGIHVVRHGFQALEEIQERLHLPKVPMRMECYDISNFHGQDPVASRVVFIEGTPDKNLYRKYKIRTVVGSNDFAMMKEVLGRRFAKTQEEEPWPDLVVVDGGKGQLAQAVAILEELGISGVSVAGLAKARTESDFQKTEVESTSERVFIPNRKNPIPLPPGSKALQCLTHLRDEAHRFAIQFHRKVRDRRILDE